jgi:hypothetical protein
MSENKAIQKGGIVISMGKDIQTRTPDNEIGGEALVVDFEGIALVVKDSYKPDYHKIEKKYGKNHVFSIPVTPELTYEYMLAAGWSYGKVNNNEKDFTEYVTTEALKYNNPPRVTIFEFEERKVEPKKEETKPGAPAPAIPDSTKK